MSSVRIPPSDVGDVIGIVPGAGLGAVIVLNSGAVGGLSPTVSAFTCFLQTPTFPALAFEQVHGTNEADFQAGGVSIIANLEDVYDSLFGA